MATQVKFDPQPVTLEGKIVRLEPLTLERAADLVAVGADDSIWRFLSTPAPTTEDKAREWIGARLADQTAGRRLPFAVICLADGNFAGSTGYAAIDRQHRTMEIASWYGVDYQRTGVNTELQVLAAEARL